MPQLAKNRWIGWHGFAIRDDRAVAVCTLFCIFLLVSPLHANCWHDGDELWLISSREMGNRPGSQCLCCPYLSYQQYVPCAGWTPACACDYFATQSSDAVTIVYVHGNRIRQDAACEQGMHLYERIRCCCPPDRRLRLVIWSWPSSPIPASFRIVRDVRVKYRRTDEQSLILARWIAQASPDTNVTFIGYSFGARVVLGALHLVGGGCLNGYALPCRPCCTPCIKIALWAAATENRWLAPGGQHACAMRVIRGGLVTVNRQDPALRRFRRFICLARQRAMGFTGIRGPLSGCCGCLYELDVTRVIGRRHSWERYVCANCVIAHTARLACRCFATM